MGRYNFFRLSSSVFRLNYLKVSAANGLTPQSTEGATLFLTPVTDSCILFSVFCILISNLSSRAVGVVIQNIALGAQTPTSCIKAPKVRPHS